MNKRKVVMTDSELKLSHGFYERSRLDITNSTSELRGIVNQGTIIVRRERSDTSMIQTSGISPDSSTGILETRSIQS
jgi:hypothetical protein